MERQGENGEGLALIFSSDACSVECHRRNCQFPPQFNIFFFIQEKQEGLHIFGTFVNSILLLKSSFIVIFLYPTYPGSFSASNSSAMLAKSFSVTATEKPTASTKQNEAKKTDIFILTSPLELEFSTVGSLRAHCFYASHSGDIKIHFSLRHPIFDHEYRLLKLCKK